MTYNEIISLGWKDRHPGSNKKEYATFIYEAEGFDYHIMSVTFGVGRGFDSVLIKCVPKETVSNEWENSETHFYGNLKTKEELDLVMQLVGITHYKKSTKRIL